jgi:tetratricopeptide (TPR) repeat protein
LQTIEMFEVIVQASPNDVQSLEILKDAYLRIEQSEGVVQTARKLAELYMSAEQYSTAVAEYEAILEREPDNVEIMALMGEAEEKMMKTGQGRDGATATGGKTGNFQPDAIGTSQLITTTQTARTNGLRPGSAAKIDALNRTLVEDGNDSLARFLMQHRIAPEDAVKGAAERVTKKNKDLAPNTMAHSLIDEVVRRAGLDMESTICSIVDRSKFAYIPLEYYEVDRQIVKMLPESLTLGRLIVPFDVMSRTLMVAMANPFDVLGKEAVQQILDFNIQWHIASPTAITKVLSETYRVAGPGIIGAGTDSPAFKLAAS